MEPGVYVREMILGVTVVVLAILCVQTFIAFKHLSLGQRLFVIGNIGYMIYVADGLHEAIVIGLTFRWRLIPLFIGLVAYVAYVTEPWSSNKSRWGNKVMQHKHSKDDS